MKKLLKIINPEKTVNSKILLYKITTQNERFFDSFVTSEADALSWAGNT